jgi:muramidase (phage lysozyme)
MQNVVVVSFMVAVPFSLVWSSFGRTGARTDLIGRGTVRAAIAAGSPVWDSLIGSGSRQRG